MATMEAILHTKLQQWIREDEDTVSTDKVGMAGVQNRKEADADASG